MPVTLYTEDDVQVYTRMLARAYHAIRDEPATCAAPILKEIERTLGWKMQGGGSGQDRKVLPGL